MPVETHYVDMGHGAYKHAYGVLTSSELLRCGMMQSQDVENTQRLKFMLYDFTDVVEARVGPDVLPQLVEFNRTTASHSQGLLSAVVAPHPAIFGFARQWQTFVMELGWHVQVFRERRDAIDWLLAELEHEKVHSVFLADFPELKPVG
jgi:hypothetical protein